MSNVAPGWQVSVGGEAAVEFSAVERISHATPVVIATMLAVIYLLLALTFRSLFLPCKAIALNLLSVGAAMGATVLIFQHGFLADTLGIASVGPILTFVPILLVVLLFSLSTDYEVFLLSRVREHYERTGDNTGSVVYGLVETAPVISGAALLMATIFAAFVAVPLVNVQQMGLAMAIAIAIDATIVRLFMVPAAMRLMGRWNWWLPRCHDSLPWRHRCSPESCTKPDQRRGVCNGFLHGDAGTVEVGCYHRRVERARKRRRYPPQQLGYRVFAGVRTESCAAELSGLPPSTGEIIPVMLDVTDAASIAHAGRLVEHGCSDTDWAAVLTPIWGKMRRSAEEILAVASAEVVETHRERLIEFLDTSEGLAQTSKTTTADYADAVATALAAKRPKSRSGAIFPRHRGILGSNQFQATRVCQLSVTLS